MGYLIKGEWHEGNPSRCARSSCHMTSWYDTRKTAGEFIRSGALDFAALLFIPAMKPFLAVARSLHGISLPYQRTFGDGAHHILIFDQEDIGIAPHFLFGRFLHRFGFCFACAHIANMRGQIDIEAGSLANL